MFTVRYYHQSNTTKKWYHGAVRNLTREQAYRYVKQIASMLPNGSFLARVEESRGA